MNSGDANNLVRKCQSQLTELLNAMLTQNVALEVNQLQEFKQVQDKQNSLINNCYINHLQKKQQHKSDSITYNLKEFISLYDTKGSQHKKIILNPGKFKMPVLATVINLKEFIKQNITNTHIAAYNKIPVNKKANKSNYLKSLIIQFNSIQFNRR